MSLENGSCEERGDNTQYILSSDLIPCDFGGRLPAGAGFVHRAVCARTEEWQTTEFGA
jgi:hypothetical protein